MTAKFWSYLGFGRGGTQAPEAPPMEQLDVSRLTECSICTEHMNNPKFLPCHHTFCCQCIQQLCRSQSTRSIPCPLCRSPFNSTSSDDAASKLPTNVYVAELMRVGAMVQDASKAKDELAAVKTKLKASEDGRQKAVDEKSRQDTELARTQRKLAKQKDLSKYVEEQRKKLSQAELYQFAIQERDKYTLEQLREMESLYETAKIEAESCRQATMKAEASLAEATESRRRLRQQLEQTQRESSEEADRLQRQIRESKEETESLVNQLFTELEQSKGVIKNLSGQIEKKQGRHVLLIMAIIIFIVYVANYRKGESTTEMPQCSIQNEQLRTEKAECLTALKALRKQLENANYKNERPATDVSDGPTTVTAWLREQPKDEKEELPTTASERSTHVDLPKAIVIAIIVILVMAAMKDLNIATPLQFLRALLRFVLRE